MLNSNEMREYISVFQTPILSGLPKGIYFIRDFYLVAGLNANMRVAKNFRKQVYNRQIPNVRLVDGMVSKNGYEIF